MKDVKWEDVAPYVVRERLSHEEGELRAKPLTEFLHREVRSEHVEVLLRGMHAPGWDNGSCTQFFMYLDDNWSPLPADRLAARHRYTLYLAVSDRGPFVISSGSEWLLSPADWAGGMEKLQPQKNVEAEAKAKALALAMASKFDLTYLDAEWLRQFKLNPKELPDEVCLSLDYSEPDALNVLFDEAV